MLKARKRAKNIKSRQDYVAEQELERMEMGKRHGGGERGVLKRYSKRGIGASLGVGILFMRT